METKFRIVTKKPNTLNEILNAFQKACDAKDIEEIFRHLDYYSENGFGGYTSIIVDYQFNMDLGRPNIYKAYLRFMSLCIFYHNFLSIAKKIGLCYMIFKPSRKKEDSGYKLMQSESSFLRVYMGISISSCG